MHNIACYYVTVNNIMLNKDSFKDNIHKFLAKHDIFSLHISAEIIEKNVFILKISGRSSKYFATNN